MSERTRLRDGEEAVVGREDATTNQEEQGLLHSWRGDGERDEEELAREVELLEAPGRTRSPRFWFIVAGTVVALAIFAVSIVLWIQGAIKETVAAEEDIFSVKSNNYVLQPDWQYDAPAQRREFTWTVREQVHNPDGIYRPMMLVNNQFPGPIIEANEGDVVAVTIHNQAENATAIHWHGIYQTGTPHMDGTPGITGCPIAPGASFTYEFNVTGQSGTYWWHAHQGVQSSDGVHGPLIIHAKNEKSMQKIEYSSDRVILLSDHYHDPSAGLLWQYLQPDMENAEPVPVGGLINGRSVRNCEQFPERRCDNTTANVGHPEFVLAPGEHHRLRLINVGAFAEFQFQVDEHELAVTEVDGTDVHPQLYHRININPAQRYSVILNASSPTDTNFWLRARMISKCFTDAPRTVDPDVVAVVRYKSDADVAFSSKETTPTSKDWAEQLALECKDMNTTDLRPVDVIAAPAAADAFFYLRSNFEQHAYRLSRGFFNGSSFRPDARQPTLLRAISGLGAQNASFHAAAGEQQQAAFVNDRAFDLSTELVIQSPRPGAVIDLFIDNFDDGQHPLHLHGYKFFVLAAGHGAPPMLSSLAGFTRENLAPLYDGLDLSNPLRRDTAAVEAYGWILLRVVADNPGAWAFHCHVSWHTEAGLMAQLLTGTDALEGWTMPQSSRDLCAAPGIEKGMGPKDEVYEDLAK